jgi:hypothetical protein
MLPAAESRALADAPREHHKRGAWNIDDPWSRASPDAALPDNFRACLSEFRIPLAIMRQSHNNFAILAAAATCLALASAANIARAQDDQEHAFVLEIGTAGEWPLSDRPNFGGTFAVETTPIENWLELEFGLTTLATAGRTELSGDLLFKKPFRLSSTVEFMIGAGPSISKTLTGVDRTTSVSPEIALDFMFWPTKNIGWFVEPTWTVNPRNGQQSAAVNAGILIGFPQR